MAGGLTSHTGRVTQGGSSDVDTLATEAGSVQLMTDDAVEEGLRAGQAATTEVLQQWVDSVVGLPFTLLAGGDVGRVMSGRVWLDGTFEVVDALVMAQRRALDQFLAAQRRTATQVVDSSWSLAALNRTAVRRPCTAGPDDARAMRR
jgi:hypothetical protein